MIQVFHINYSGMFLAEETLDDTNFIIPSEWNADALSKQVLR
jgi:hypothetical protein